MMRNGFGEGKMKRNPAYLSVALGLVFVWLFVFGSTPSPAQSRGKQWWTSTNARQQLNLTDDQVERIDALQQALRERISSIRRAETRALREMVSTLDDPSAPPDVVEERRQQLDGALLGDHQR